MAANPADVPSYTSRVPEALQNYYDAMEHYAVAEMDQAVPLLEEAVKLDPKFAQAHNMLALTINASRRYDEGFHEIDLALRLADKLPERERVSIETNYYRMTEDPVKSVETAKRSLAYRPDEPRCYSILGQELAKAGNAAEALYYYRKAVELAPDDWMQILLLEDALVESGRSDQALSEFQLALSRRVPNKWIYNGAGAAYVGLERYDDAISAYMSEPLDSENTADIQGAKIMQGHLEVAIAAMEEQRASSRSPMEAHQANEFLCGLYFVTDRPESALRYVRDMADLPVYPPMARRLACTASWARRLGDDETLGRTHGAAAEIAQRWPNAHTQAIEMLTGALQLWRKNALEETESLLLMSSGEAFNIWTLFDLADFFTRRGKWELAEAYWQKFEAHRGTVIVDGWFPGILVLGWLYRAIAAQQRNDRGEAFKNAQKVLDHWARANLHLRVVQSAIGIKAVSKPL